MTVSESSILNGARVRLTPLQYQNIHQHYEWNNDAELNYFDSEVPHHKETFGAFKHRFEQMVYKPSPDGLDFEIYAEDGALIGVVYLANLSEHHRHGLIGVTIGDRAYWGKGYGRESLETMLAFCFGELGLHRVSAETFEYNKAWKKLVEEVGFHKEGEARDYLFRGGRFWTKETYALLEAEYSARVSHYAVAASWQELGRSEVA